MEWIEESCKEINKVSTFKTFMDKMSAAEKSVQENGYYMERSLQGGILWV